MKLINIDDEISEYLSTKYSLYCLVTIDESLVSPEILRVFIKKLCAIFKIKSRKSYEYQCLITGQILICFDSKDELGSFLKWSNNYKRFIEVLIFDHLDKKTVLH